MKRKTLVTNYFIMRKKMKKNILLTMALGLAFVSTNTFSMFNPFKGAFTASDEKQLHKAIVKGNNARVKRLLEANIDPNGRYHSKSWVYKDRENMIDVAPETIEYNSLPHTVAAAHCQNLVALQLLLSHGAFTSQKAKAKIKGTQILNHGPDLLKFTGYLQKPGRGVLDPRNHLLQQVNSILQPANEEVNEEKKEDN